MRSTSRLLRAALAIVTLLLSGCFGGSVAQQLASSLAMHAADQITAGAMESHALGTGSERQDTILANRAPDPYWADFVTAGFAPVTAQVEPLPEPATAAAKPAAEITATPLLRIEIWNLLVGEEKRAFLEAAQLREASSLPPRNEWSLWQVASGGMLGEAGKSVTFLIPPGFGRVASGEHAVVERVAPGDLYYVRYTLN